MKNAESQTETTNTKIASRMKYFWVVFSEPSDDTGSPDVTLSINGDTLNIKRGEKVILPENFVEVAENAKVIGKKFNPISQAMTTKVIQRFPFNVLGPATEAEYLKMKADGTRKTIEEMKKRERMGEENLV